MNSISTGDEKTSLRSGKSHQSADIREFTRDAHWPNDLEVEGWSDSVCARTQETREHLFFVAEMTVRLARLAGFPASEIPYIRYGALLHDVGKIGIPNDILLKPSSLTMEEWDVMHRHPRYAYELLYPVSFLRQSLAIPFHHHEKWDGSGYPQGLKGEEIPFAARLFAVVDTWDSLASERPFHPAWKQEEAMDYIQQQAGSQFDPQAVELFLSVMDQGHRADLSLAA